jgi:broad specificity phosphatase PhoE
MPRADRTTGTRPDRRAASRRRADPTPATIILLVRHGTTATTGTKLPGRAPGLHLAEEGLRQAENVATRIARSTTGETRQTRKSRQNGQKSQKSPKPDEKRGVAAVYSSPLERTRETAAPIAAAVKCDVQIDEALIELDVGDWTGLDLKEAYKRPEWATIQRYPSGFTFPNGESFVEMQGRMIGALGRLRARHPGETVVAVSHADPIRAAVAYAMGTHLDLFQRVVVSPCSLTAIALGDGGPTILTVNATGDPDPTSVVPS